MGAWCEVLLVLADGCWGCNGEEMEGLRERALVLDEVEADILAS